MGEVLCGGARGGSSASPQCVRFFWITSGRVGSMKLTIFIVEPHRALRRLAVVVVGRTGVSR